jgi:Resolvase, N terminal domain
MSTQAGARLHEIRRSPRSIDQANISFVRGVPPKPAVSFSVAGYTRAAANDNDVPPDPPALTAQGPGLQQLMQASISNEIRWEVIVVTDFDRLFRDLVQVEQYTDQLETQDIFLVSISKSRDLNSP